MTKQEIRAKRLKLLLFLINQIKSGEFSMPKEEFGDLCQFHNRVNNTARREYTSPFDLNSNNWGYFTSGDFGAGNN